MYHFAATVGVGQSMYEIAHYTSANGVGTAMLLEALAAQPVERLVVASSMSIYGEGLYRRPTATPSKALSAPWSSSARTTGKCGTRTARR